jgi:serine/threonine protein kinase
MVTPREVRLLAGRYRLLEPLGEGGMGVVWRSRDELLGRDVAVKEVLIPPELPAGEQQMLRKRMLREARSAARLSHPNVVTIFDVVEETGRPWIVMEFVPCRSLARVLREDGPLPPRQVAEIGLQVLAR